MNEKYGIELQAIVDKFKAKMQGTANFIKGLGKRMEEDVTIGPDFVIDPNLSKEQLENFKKQLEKNINSLKKRIDTNKLLGVKNENNELVFSGSLYFSPIYRMLKSATGGN